MIQKPFTFSERNPRQLRSFPTAFSKNIKGICMVCGYRVQKVRYEQIKKKLANGTTKITVTDHLMPCPRCTKQGRTSPMLKFPEELIPWKIAEQFSHSPFFCNICQRRYFSLRVFTALCTHKKHQYPNYTCRFCCTKVDTDVSKKTNKKKAENPEFYWTVPTQRQELQGISFSEDRYFNNLMANLQESQFREGSTAIPLPNTLHTHNTQAFTNNPQNFEIETDYDDDIDLEEPF
jgi:hypothetical protein